MSHFAKVLLQPFNIIVDGKSVTVRGGIVQNVIVAELEFFETFVDSTPGEWIQTSYNTKGGIHYEPNSNFTIPDDGEALRANYAVIGGYYDSVNDVFYSEQPFPSWTLSAPDWIWTPPSPYPTNRDGIQHYWDEVTLSWIAVTVEE
jgi:hypothetical protein